MQLFSVCEDTLPTAVWFEMCQVVPLVEKIVTDKQLSRVAEFFVHTFPEAEMNAPDR